MAPDPGGHAPRPGCRRRPGAQRPRHRRRARSTVSCSLAEVDATDPGAARATTPAPRPMTRTSPCSTRCLTLTLTRSAGREPGNQNWCREHAPGPRVGRTRVRRGWGHRKCARKCSHAKAHPSLHLQTQSFGSTALLHLQDEQRHRGVLKTGSIPFLPGKPAPGRFTGDQLQARLSMNVSHTVQDPRFAGVDENSTTP